MDRYVDARIRSGHYANASEVIRAGLRALEQGEKEDRARLVFIREAVLAAEESGIADGDVMKEIRERMKRRALATGRA
jgi:antitoxin ParD1/3/4